MRFRVLWEAGAILVSGRRCSARAGVVNAGRRKRRDLEANESKRRGAPVAFKRRAVRQRRLFVSPGRRLERRVDEELTDRLSLIAFAWSKERAENAEGQRSCGRAFDSRCVALLRLGASPHSRFR